MTVQTDICNAALIKLAQEPIEDISNDEKNARLCKARYQTIVDQVLRDSLWSFAIKRQVLPKKSESLAYGDGDIYALPQDSVRVVRIGRYPGSSGHTREYYKIEGNDLIIFGLSGDQANLMYISNDISEAMFDASFKEAVALKLAVELCYAITQSTSLKNQLLQEYEQITLPASKSINSQEVSPDAFAFDTFLNARQRNHGQIHPDADFV